MKNRHGPKCRCHRFKDTTRGVVKKGCGDHYHPYRDPSCVSEDSYNPADDPAVPISDITGAEPREASE